MTIQQFFDRWLNKICDWDGYYGGQCVDLYDQYCQDVVGSPIILIGGAADIWSNYPTSHFDRVLNTPTAIPKLGDVMIWDRTSSLPYGHVSIFKSGDINNFTSFDQNWPTGSVCKFVNHNYNGVIGWLTPKAQQQPIPADDWKAKYEDKCKIETELRNVIQQKDKLIEDLNKQLTTCSANGDLCQTKLNSITLEKQEVERQLAIYKASYDQLPKTKELLDQAEEDKKNLKIEITNLNAQLTKKTNQYNNLKKSGIKFIQHAVIMLCEKLGVDLT